MKSGTFGRCLFGAVAFAQVSLFQRLAVAQELDPKAVGELLNLNKILTSLVILAVAFVIARVASGALDNLGSQLAARKLLLKKVASLVRFSIYILAALIIIMGVLQPDRETLFALSAALAVTIGLALKDLTGSIIAGMIVLVDSPFQVGDRVQFGDTYGEVVEIGLRTVKINTLDDNLVSIPNNKFLTDAVASSNAGALDMMIVMDFFIGVDEDYKQARAIVEEATLISRFVFLKKPIVVHVHDVLVGDSYGTRIRSKFYVSDTSYETAIKTDITQNVKEAFREAGIRSPYHKESSVS
jgi:small-conductance mechanosensitive channel